MALGLRVPVAEFPHPAYCEGRLWFHNGRLVTCVDRDGAVIIPPKYEIAQDFSEGLAAVSICSESAHTRTEQPPVWLYGYVNRSGDLVVPMRYEEAGKFVDGLARTRRPHAKFDEFIDRTGRVVFAVQELNVRPSGFISYCSEFSCGRASLWLDDGSKKRSVRLLDTSGKFVSEELPYNVVLRFSDGLAAAYSGREGVAFLDTSGKVAFKRRFDFAGEFREGLCRLRVGDSWLFIDRNGSVAVSPRRALAGESWNDATDFLGGLARVHVGGEFQTSNHGVNYWRGGTWNYIDRNGNTVAICRKDGEWPIRPLLGREYHAHHD